MASVVPAPTAAATATATATATAPPAPAPTPRPTTAAPTSTASPTTATLVPATAYTPRIASTDQALLVLVAAALGFAIVCVLCLCCRPCRKRKRRPVENEVWSPRHREVPSDDDTLRPLQRERRPAEYSSAYHARQQQQQSRGGGRQRYGGENDSDTSLASALSTLSRGGGAITVKRQRFVAPPGARPGDRIVSVSGSGRKFHVLVPKSATRRREADGVAPPRFDVALPFDAAGNVAVSDDGSLGFSSAVESSRGGGGGGPRNGEYRGFEQAPLRGGPPRGEFEQPRRERRERRQWA